MQLLDTVALSEDLPAYGIRKGQVGTLVEELEQGVFVVEFSDTDGRAYALLALRDNQLLQLYHTPMQQAASVGFFVAVMFLAVLTLNPRGLRHPAHMGRASKYLVEHSTQHGHALFLVFQLNATCV